MMLFNRPLRQWKRTSPSSSRWDRLYWRPDLWPIVPWDHESIRWRCDCNPWWLLSVYPRFSFHCSRCLRCHDKGYTKNMKKNHWLFIVFFLVWWWVYLKRYLVLTHKKCRTTQTGFTLLEFLGQIKDLSGGVLGVG